MSSAETETPGGTADEDEDWKRLTAEQFLKSYGEADAAYDDLLVSSLGDAG